MTTLEVRSATEGDQDFLASMLYEAAYWRTSDERPEPSEALAAPELRVYLEDWGRDGDRALVATAGDDRLGAAWYRLFDDERHGYGFVEATIPEIAMAVSPSHRRLGVGRMVLAALLVQARLDDFLAVSLSVEDDNPAASLYTTLGFEPVEDADPSDRAGRAVTMVNRFALR